MPAIKSPAEIRRELPRLTSPRLPQALQSAPAPLGKLATEHEDLQQRATEAITKVIALEARWPEAQQEDRAAEAAAQRAGKPGPGPKAAQALQSEIEMARREVTGLVDATNGVWAEIKAALVEHAPAWREQVQAQQAKQVAAGTKGYDTAKQASREVAESRALLRYISQATDAITGERPVLLRRFPHGVQPSDRVIIGQVPYPVEQVIGELQAHLDGEAP
jgi:predicted transcriptional regulator